MLVQGLLSRRIDQEALRARLQLGCLVTGSSEGQVQGCRATVPCKSLVGLETTGPYPGLVLEQPALGAPLYGGGLSLELHRGEYRGATKKVVEGVPNPSSKPPVGVAVPPMCALCRGQGTGAQRCHPMATSPCHGVCLGGVWGLQPPPRTSLWW